MDAAVEALRQPLRAVIATLALEVSDAQIDAFLGYLTLLQRWNAHYNLTAVRDPAAMLTQHVADCLAVIGPLQRQLRNGPARVLDVGSGGGLPGVVIAALNPQIEVTCVDSVGKKAAFVRHVAGELGLRNLQAKHARVERLEEVPFDVVTSRAFASLTAFVSLTRHALAAKGVWLAMKGKLPSEELAALPAGIDVFHVEQLRVPHLDAERCLVWMRPKP